MSVSLNPKQVTTHYTETTNGMQVEVFPEYVPEQSCPERGLFFFSYRVRITNLGPKPTQLMDRHWIIRDGKGIIREVKGPGVVGQQPKIEPGQSFEYSSFCPLPTPTGNMRGSFLMREEEGDSFATKIPLFFLRDTRHLEMKSVWEAKA